MSERDCDNCVFAARSGGCRSWECEFIPIREAYVAWLEKQTISQTEKSYPEMVLAIYDAGYAYDAIHHLLKLLEEAEKDDDD